jgi:hypothetical protein
MRTELSDLIAAERAESLDRVSLMVLVGVGGLLLTRTLLAANAAFEADEFDAYARGAELLADPAHRLGHPHRLLASLIFAVGPLVGPHDAVVGMVLNRVVAVGACVVIYLAVLRIGGRTFGTLAGIHALVGLGMVYVFIDHSFTARADFLWLTLATGALALLLERRAPWVALAGVALGLAYFVSLKAVLMIGAVGVGVGATVITDRRRGLRDLLLLAGGFAAVQGIYLLLRAVLHDPTGAGALDQAVSRVQLLAGADTGVGHAQFYWAALRQNPLFCGVAVTGLALGWAGLWRWRGEGERRRDVLLVLAAITAYLPAMWVYPQPWPYFLATAAPGLALAWGLLAGAVHRQLRIGGTAPLWAGAVAVLVVAGLLRPADRVRRNLEMDNGYQVAVMDRLGEVLGPGDTYFDGVGIAPNLPRTTDDWLDVVTLVAYRDDPDALHGLLADIANGQTGAVVANWRTDQLPAEFRVFRDRFFVQDWGNVFVPGREYETAALVGRLAVLPAVTPGSYHVRGAEDAWRVLTIDDTPLTGPSVRLAIGDHRVSASADVGRIRILRLREGFEETREPLEGYKALFPRERFLLEH